MAGPWEQFAAKPTADATPVGGLSDEKPWTRFAARPTPTGGVSDQQPLARKPVGFGEAAVRGFKRSLPETKSLLYGGAAAVGGLVGADSVRDWGLNNYRRVQDEEIRPLENQASFKGVITGGDSLGEWASDTLGNLGGQALQSAAAATAGGVAGGVAGAPAAGVGAAPGAVVGAIGGLAARGTARKLITGEVEKLVAEQVAKGAARETAEAAGQALLRKRLGQVGGAALGGAALNVGQEVGTAFTGRADDAQAAGEQLTQGDAARAIGWGVPAGLVDTATEALNVGRFFAPRPTASLTRRVAQRAAEGALVEGGTEAVQGAMERAGANQQLTGAEAYDDYLENFAAGALGGAAIGGASGVRRGEPHARRPQPTVQPPAEPERRALPAPDPNGSPPFGVNIVTPGGTVLTPEQRGLDPRVTGEPAPPAPNPGARPGLRVADDSLTQPPLARRPQPSVQTEPAGEMLRAARPQAQAVATPAPLFADAPPGSIADAANLIPARPAAAPVASERAAAPAPVSPAQPAAAPALPPPWIDQDTGEMSREPTDADVKHLVHQNLQYQFENSGGISSPVAERFMRDNYGLPSKRVRPLLQEALKERQRGITSSEPGASAPAAPAQPAADAQPQAPAELGAPTEPEQPSTQAVYAEEVRKVSPDTAAMLDRGGRPIEQSADATRLAAAIGLRDLKALKQQGIENPDKAAVRATFARMTGVELPPDRAGTAAALKAWANELTETSGARTDERAEGAEATPPAGEGQPAAGEAVQGAAALRDDAGAADAAEPVAPMRADLPDRAAGDDGSPDAQPALSDQQPPKTPPTGGVSASGPARFPRVDEQEVHNFGPGSIRPRAVAEGKPLYREMSTDNLDSALFDERSYSTSQVHVTDDAALAIGQGKNRGVQVTYRPDSVSGRENVKPGTGIIGGREYQTDLIAPRAIASITMAKDDIRKLRGVTRVLLGQEFDRTNLEDGRVRFDRKGLERDTTGEAQERGAAGEAPARQAEPTTPAPSVTEAAAQAATSPDNELPDATPAQREAGNFKVGRMKAAGMDVSIEYPAGVKRKPDHKALTRAYGYFRGTVGRDKDHVDVFLGEHADNPNLPVFVVDQLDRNGRFDEHKVVLGEESEAAARQAYLSNYPDDWSGLGGITQMTQEQFKDWVRDPEKTKRRLTRAPRAAAKEAAPPRPAAAPEPTEQLEDVGEKIGGARKDLWKERGLRLADLDGMTGGEQAMYAVKNNVWKPDYAGLVADGMEPAAASLAKAIWDKVPVKPIRDTEEGRRQYVEALNIAREVLEGAKTVADVERAADAFKERTVPKGVGRLANMPAIWKHAPVYGAAMRRSGSSAWPFGTLRSTDRRAATERVAGGWPGEATWHSNFKVGQWSVRQPNGEMARRYVITRAKRQDGKPADSIAGDPEGYGTMEAAVAAAEALHAARSDAPKAPGATRTKEPPRPHLDNVPRTGEDYRKGKDVSAEDFRQAFGFRGVEFGNWAAQDERRKLVNLAYDGLMDLAKVLNIPPAAISLDGTLGLALGARGSGGAAAHYEPGKVVINMTKLNGAGALAHEWGHALDHYFGEFGQDNAYGGRGRYISGGRGQPTYSEDAPFQQLRPEMQQAWRDVLKTIYRKAMPQAERVRALELQEEALQAKLDATPAPTDHSDSFAIANRAVVDYRLQAVRKELEFARSQPADATWDGGASDVHKAASAMGAYWKRPTEMLARSFEAYVQAKIRAEGNRSQYLASVPAHAAWPQGAELQRVTSAFDRLFGQMQTRQTERGTALFSLGDDAQTDTPAFKRWFGDSKVVDEAGKPMVVFHGTNEDFDVFDIDRAGQASGFTDWGEGFYFTDARDAAETYADDPDTGRVLQAYLKITNPATNEVVLSQEIQDILDDDMGFVSMQEALEAKGYDGIQFTHKDGKREFVAFRPEQVKSATDNNGNFDAANPSMLFSVGEGRGLSMNRALQLKRDLTAKWGENAPSVVVVENAEGFPADARVDPNYTRAEGFYNGTPTVYINAGRIHSEERFAQVLAHEALGHFGVEAIVGPAEWRGITDAIARLEAEGKGGEATRAVLADVRRRYGQIDRDTFAKEAIAVMAERGIQNGLVNRVIAAARRWLRRLMPSLQWTENDVRALLGQADSFLHAGRSNEERAAVVRAYAFSQGERPAPLRPDPAEAEQYRKDFDRYVNSRATNVPPVTIGRTPAVLRAVGVPDAPMTISRDTVRKASNGVKHQVSRDSLRRLPELLADPVAVFESKTIEGGKTVLLELQDSAGNPVMAALHVTGKDGGKLSINRIASVYGRPDAQYAAWAREGLLRYLSDTKNAALRGLQLPSSNPREQTVLREADIVNPPAPAGAGGVQGGPAGRLFSLPGDDALADIDAVQAAAQPEGVVARARQLLKDFQPGKLKDATRPTWLGALTTRHLTELGSDYFKGISHFSDYLTQMQADRNTLQEQAEGIAEGVRKWAGKNRTEATRMFDLMHQATIEGVDPAEDYKPLQFRFGGILQDATQKNVAHAVQVIREQMRGRAGDAKKNFLDEVKSLNAMRKAEPRRKRAYGPLVAQWNQLSPEAKAHYVQMRDAYQERSKAVEEALVQRIKDLKGDGVSDQQVQVMITKIRQQFESNRLQGVYFPLQRFGEFFVSAGKGDASTFLMFPSLNELDRAVKDLKAKGWVINAQGRKSDGKAKDAPSGTFVADVINELRKAHVSDATQDAVYQVYLQALPELSMRKHQIHRKAIPGFDRDALRAFAYTMHHGSHQLARLRYAHKLTSIVDMLKKNQDAARREPDADTRKISAGDAILSELDRRHEWIMNPTDNQLTNLISSAGFLYYLGATPAAALVNLSQTALVSYPYLAARHGGVKAMNALLSASKDAIRTVGNIQKTLTSEEERRAHAALLASGALDKTQAHNLAGIAEGGMQRYNPAWSKAMEIIGWGFHKTEVVNREATGLAAFRLARANGESFDAAVRFAHDTIFDTHFDYSNANRARYMQSGAAKALLMFRQYGLNMTWMLARNLWQATKGESPEVKRIARRNLAGILGMSSLFSGVLGLPTASVVMGVMNAVAASLGDDDEPWDAETEFAAFLADMLGKDAAQVVLHGGANALTGADIAGRTGLSDLWFRDADRELEGRGYYYSLLEQAAGPMGGVLKNVIVGKNLIDEGHTWRGIETMLPKSLRDMMKAGRYATQGVNTLRGDPLVADSSVYDVLLQGAGFSPAKVAEKYERNNALMNYQDFIIKRRQHLMDAYAMSIRLGDQEARAAAFDKIRAFNQANPEVAISAKSIKASIKSRARYSAQAENGIVLNPKLAARLRSSVDGEAGS